MLATVFLQTTHMLKMYHVSFYPSIYVCFLYSIVKQIANNHLLTSPVLGI